MTFQVIEDERYTDAFMDILVGEMRKEIVKRISPTKITLFVGPFKKLYEKPITDQNAYTILFRTVLWGVRNLKYRKHKKAYQIYLPPHNYLQGTKISFVFLCEMMDAGTLDIPGTHIFSNSFHAVMERIDDLYSLYSGE